MRERTVRGDGIDLHVTEAGDGPPVILAHGFPELAYSWRHQLPALAAAGYHAVAPDMRGYGRTDQPPAIDDYDILHLTGDLLAILDDLGHERAVFVGHDWGAQVVWTLSQLHPERVAGVVGMSVPFLPRGPVPPISMLRELFAGSFFYMLHFQQPGVADDELAADPAATMRRLLGAARHDPAEPFDMTGSADDGRGFVERIPEPAALPEWLGQAELDHYVAEFSRTGFTGGLNWYRNLDRNWEHTPQLDGVGVSVPSLFVGGSFDPVLALSPPAASTPFLQDHRGTVLVDGAGHWVQQERPTEVNDALLGFLGSLDLGT